MTMGEEVKPMVKISYINHLQGMAPKYEAFIKVKNNIAINKVSKLRYKDMIGIKWRELMNMYEIEISCEINSCRLGCDNIDTIV